MQEALDKANLTEKDLSAIAVTIGPGLSLCLRGNLSSITFFFLSLFQWCVYVLRLYYQLCLLVGFVPS